MTLVRVAYDFWDGNTTASYTCVALTQKLRRVVDESLGYGLALEGLSVADVAY
jgi:hypothetical protein